MASPLVDCYSDGLTINDLINYGLWTVVDSESFTTLFNARDEDEWPLEYTTHTDDLSLSNADTDSELVYVNEPYDRFNEFR